jgi:hypothetical protein
MNVLWMGSKIHLIRVTNSILLVKSRSPSQETRASDNRLSDYEDASGYPESLGDLSP